MNEKVDIEPAKGGTGTLFHPGLSLTADHLIHEFSFVLSTALLGVASHSWGRDGVIRTFPSGSQPPARFAEVVGETLKLSSFSFILNGFAGTTREDLVIKLPPKDAKVKLTVRENQYDLRDRQESEKIRFRIDAVDNKDLIICTLSAFWDGTDLWPTVADFRATAEWRAKAENLNQELLELANELKRPVHENGEAAAIGVMVARGRAFPNWAPWWRDQVFEAVTFALELTSWVSTLKVEGESDWVWSDDPQEIRSRVDDLARFIRERRTQLEKRRKPWLQEVLPDSGEKQVKLQQLKELNGTWTGTLHTRDINPENATDAILVIVEKTDAEEPQFRIEDQTFPGSHKAGDQRFEGATIFEYSIASYRDQSITIRVTTPATASFYFRKK